MDSRAFLQPTYYHGSVGAGFEGWMKGPASSTLLLAMSKHLLAMAKPRAVMIIKCFRGQVLAEQSSAVKFSIALSLPLSEEGHHIKCIQWLVFHEFSVLAMGTSQGSVLCYSSKGILLFRQVFQNSPVLQIRIKGCNSSSSEYSYLEDICVIYPDVLVHINTSDLQQLLKKCLCGMGHGGKKGRFSSIVESYLGPPRVSHQIWNVSKNIRSSVCMDGVICGVLAPSLFEYGQTGQRHFCAITVGIDYVYAVHRMNTECRLLDNNSNTFANLISTKIVPAALSIFESLRKKFFHESSTETRPVEVAPQYFGKASLVAELKDESRKAERISLSPVGSLAALTDSLGRILLIDTKSLIVIRLWKGYRDAQCFFLEVPLANELNSKRFALCLAIHAPRKGVVEVWKLRYGPRVSIIVCGWGSHVIQPSLPLQGSELRNNSDRAPAEVYILNGISGHVVAIRPYIDSP